MGMDAAMPITPEALEDEFSLTTAATRLDFLSRRDSGDTSFDHVKDVDDDDWSSIRDAGTSLDGQEALELLALGEVIARKAHGSRLVGIRAALRGGAGWDDIGAALGLSPQEAWDAFARSIDQHVGARRLSEDAAASARALAGGRP
jgi:hypothetical protein